MLASVTDVERRLGRELDAAETSRADGLLEEASVLVEEYLGHTPAPVPDTVRVVTSRMVARVLSAPKGASATALAPGQLSSQMSMGPFGRSATYEPGSTSGGPWLEAKDKATLRRHRLNGGMVSVAMSSEHTGRYRMRS